MWEQTNESNRFNLYYFALDSKVRRESSLFILGVFNLNTWKVFKLKTSRGLEAVEA